ncbi:MAG: alpha/beta hydrolase [Acidobacteriota bacterium]
MNEEKFVDIDGIRTRYFEQGSGEALLLVHGGTFGQSDNIDCADNWDLNWDSFARSFHVYAVDKIGQGFTHNPPEEDYTIEAVVRHAYGFLRAMGIERVSLVGHSRGGYLVTRLTMQHPELVKALVVVDSSSASPHLDDNAGLLAVKSEHRKKLLAGVPEPLLSKESIRWVTQQFSISDDHITESWLSIRERVAQQAQNAEAVKAMKRLEKDLFLPGMLKQKEETLNWIKEGGLQTPTLLVWGYNDPTAILGRGMKLFDLVTSSAPRSQMHIFNRAGHYSYREHPEDFVRVVTDFIAGTSN